MNGIISTLFQAAACATLLMSAASLAIAADLSDAIRRNARQVNYMDVGDAGVVRNRNTPRD